MNCKKIGEQFSSSEYLWLPCPQRNANWCQMHTNPTLLKWQNHELFYSKGQSRSRQCRQLRCQSQPSLQWIKLNVHQVSLRIDAAAKRDVYAQANAWLLNATTIVSRLPGFSMPWHQAPQYACTTPASHVCSQYS